MEEKHFKRLFFLMLLGYLILFIMLASVVTQLIHVYNNAEEWCLNQTGFNILTDQYLKPMPLQYAPNTNTSITIKNASAYYISNISEFCKTHDTQ